MAQNRLKYEKKSCPAHQRTPTNFGGQRPALAGRTPAPDTYVTQKTLHDEGQKIGSKHSGPVANCNEEVGLLNIIFFPFTKMLNFFCNPIQVKKGKHKGKRRQLQQGLQKFIGNAVAQVATKITVSGVVDFIENINSD